jgi:hypothetical protein
MIYHSAFSYNMTLGLTTLGNYPIRDPVWNYENFCKLYLVRYNCHNHSITAYPCEVSYDALV